MKEVGNIRTQIRSSAPIATQFLAVLPALALLGSMILLITNFDAPQHAGALSHVAQTEATSTLNERFGKVPLVFEANQGQTDERVKFLSRGPGYSLFLTSTDAVLTLHGFNEAKDTADVLRMKLLGVNPHPKIEAGNRLAARSNYFIGGDRAKWRENVPTYDSVHYREVYRGIDVVYYGNQRQLENDFVIAPGMDPKTIKLSFVGAKNISLTSNGDLLLRTNGGTVQLRKPVAYQEINGARREIDIKYELSDLASSTGGQEHAVGFDTGNYDRTRSLVIDPVLVYSTYLGGISQDNGFGIVVDTSGNAYVIGSTSSANFPPSNAIQPLRGARDVFVTKFNPSGSAIVYSTFLGGTNDGGTENGFDIAVDGGGNAYLTGITAATDFPVLNAAQSTIGSATQTDAFISKLTTAGALAYSTYLGGIFADNGQGIATDGAGNAYVTGIAGNNFPVTLSAFQATGAGFVAKLNTNGSGASSLLYSSYLISGVTFTQGRAIAADVTGNVYVAGTTNSPSIATTGAAQTTFGGVFDAFVSKFNTNLSGSASRIYSTYLGGSSSDRAGASGSVAASKAIAIDPAGNAYITGQTSSTNFPTSNAFQNNTGGVNDAFLTRRNASGSSLIYSTYLGGTGDDEGRGVAVNVVGNAYVTGAIGNTFPTVASISATGGIFVSKFTPDGSALVYSTRLGGAGDAGNGVGLDGAGNAFITGSTNFVAFQTLNPFQPNGGGGTDAFVSEIADPTIIGRVVDEDNHPIAGATVNLTGVPTATTTTDADGYFTFGLLTAGNNYTVSVTVANYIFNSQTVNNLVKNVRLDFSPVVISIGGQVTLGAGGLAGTTMTLSGGKSLVTTTDAGGNYAFANLPAGRSYTVSPSKPAFGFEPTSRTFSNVLTNQTANFIASATFQFSVGSYVATETNGFAVITVQRTSGASGPASVDFLTLDGTAIQRTDYTITIGRLNFATDETSKNFIVPIIDDLYVEGDETINVALSNPVGATIGTPNPALVTITDNDSSVPATNPLDNADARFFVRQHYLDFLNRIPDQGGFDFWSASISSCGNDPVCLHARRVGVSNAFFFELEYQQTGSYVQRLYRAAYGNNQPSPNTETDANFPNEEKKMPNYAVFSVDRAAVVGGGDLPQKQLDLANTFVARPEFISRYPASLATAGQFVDAVLGTIQTDLGVNLSGERNNLISLYNSLGRGGVMYRIADDNVQTNPVNNRGLIDAEYNRSFVLGEYFGYLRRNPDIGGFVFWLGQVNSGALRDVTKQHAMVCSFITSTEYQQRFSTIVTHNNTECP
jgi:Calx-beta domain-containing protein/carboxypeptidase family protein/beta-propeller repeat-containing protein